MERGAPLPSRCKHGALPERSRACMRLDHALTRQQTPTRCLVGHTHTHTHTQAAWLNFRGAGMCSHGTKVASSCQRFRASTHAQMHTPSLLRWCHAFTTFILIYICVDASAMASAAIAGEGVCNCSPALAFLYFWPPSPLAIIHGSFASPGTQCCKIGMNASLICS